MELITERPEWFEEALNKQYQNKTVEINGAKIHYMEWGDPKNQSVIMLHGTNAHAHWFQFIGALMAENYHFVTMSFSGMGESDWRSSYDRDTFVEDVWGVINDAKMDNPVIVGHSFGGMASLITASKWSHLMAGLLLVDFVVYKPEEHFEWYQDREPARPPRIVSDREELLKRFRLMPPQDCENQFLVDFIAENSIRKTETGWSWTFDPATYDGLTIGSDHSKILSELSCPVGFFYGENTMEFNARRGVNGMKELLPKGSPIAVLKGAQHHLMLDKPLEFIDKLKELIQTLISN
ncbi:MAG: hypothetical protein CL432_06675 [Acidimicrobiaceae bacterium]|nr:hypothetical protein [Acidimicrobiaceae bacterium]HJL95939.1 alpha/beta hydrolase [SAR86 cluster bacterium]HJM59833.1 alpha/beta hydrolase [SAR86 cluster bacterium]|tara:strand:+ start:8490 stop:9371 length:882 start_codon:yes stop_codon:yes gene_type:complete